MQIEDRGDPVLTRYLSDEYADCNPSWDRDDSSWKTGWVLRMLEAGQLRPRTIVEVGCGAGDVLAGLSRQLPDASLRGFDIAPAAEKFWSGHASKGRVEFTLGDFLTVEDQHHDVLIMLDVLEHLANPFDYLVRIRGRADHFIFHFPLDLSVVSVMRERPLLHVREKVGHVPLLYSRTRARAVARLWLRDRRCTVYRRCAERSTTQLANPSCRNTETLVRID